MLCRETGTGWFTLIMLVVLPSTLLAAPIEIQELQQTIIAELMVNPAHIDWLPQDDYERVILTISGPGGFYLQQEFEADQTPSLNLLDEAGAQLADGIYIYELRVTQHKYLDTQKARVQSGSFHVQGGEFVTLDDPRERNLDRREETRRPPMHVTEADQVINDNLILIGQACIGPDCLPGFPGYDIVIKDTVPSIRLVDTTPCCSNDDDWLIQTNIGADNFVVKNESTSGTDTKPFIISGGAPDNALFVASTSNIGLGTATPAVRLDVKASVTGQATERLQNTSATGYSGTEYLDNTGNVDLFFGIDNTASTTRLNSTNNNPIVILTNSVERMRITTDGNLGIGTASPSGKFHFFENIDASTIFTVENPNTGSLAASVLRAKSDSALAGLIAHSSGKTASRFGQTLGGWAELLQATGNGLIIGTQVDKPLILGTNSVNRVQVTASGDVGVGTTAPSSKLHVNGGDIRVSGGSFIDDGVTLNTPDYVFEPSYRLMSLEELREFVTKKKHLPNVPNAREVKEQGLNLSQFQMRLLEKLEELTLYTLKQDEQIKAQQARIDELQSELKTRLEALEQATAAEQQ